MTSDGNDTNFTPPADTRADPANGTFDSFTCNVCGTTFPAPGFDANQVAQALRAHVAANHQDRLAQATLDALAAQPKNAPDDELTDAVGDRHGTTAVTGTVHEEIAARISENTAEETDSPVLEDSAAPDGALPSSTAAGDAGAFPSTPPANPETNSNDAPRNHGAGGGTRPDPEARTVNKPGDQSPVPPVTPGTTNRKPAYERLPRDGDVQPDPVGEPPVATNRGAGTPAANAIGRGRASGDADRGAGENDRGDDRAAAGATGPGGAKRPGSANEHAATKTSGKDTAKHVMQDPKGAAKQAATRAVEKSLETAGSSVGIPPQVTRIAVKVAKRVLPIGLAMVLIMLAALGGSALFGGQNAEDYVWNVPLSEQLDIPEPYLDAYVAAARRNKIPWTLLAAVGANATYHGRIDPYKQEIPLPAVTPDEGDTKNFVLLADAGLAGVETYLDPFLAPAGYSVNVVAVPGGTIGSAVDWLDANDVDNSTPIVVALGAGDTGTPQEFAEKVDSLLNRRGLHNRIHWLTLATEGSGPYNEVLRERDRLRPNLALVDWAALVDERGVVVDANGNVDATGQRLRAGLIAAAIVGNVVSAGLPVASGLSGPGVLPTPTGSCPSLAVPIAGENPSQGAGPLMLVPSALSAAGYDIGDDTRGDDMQNICESADVLADALAQTARIVAADEGTTFPGGIANLALRAAAGDAAVTERVHKFWAKVLDASGVLGDTVERDCVLPEQGSLDDQSHVGNMIDSYWRCTLAGTELFSVTDATVDAAGNVGLTQLRQPDAVARGVDEALSVAWAWSSWGTGACDDTALHAGVFPLTAAVFAAHADEPGKGRCDRGENVKAAAKAYAAREGVPAATRGGKWSATIGGWALIGPVASPAGPTNFDAVGPWRPLYAGETCAASIVDAVVTIGNDASFLAGYTAAQAQEIAFAGTFDEFDTTGRRTDSTLTDEQLIAITGAVDEKLAGVVAAARTNPECAQERGYADEEWLGVVAGTVNGDALTALAADGSGPRIPAATRGDLAVPANTGDRIAALSGRAASRSGGWGGVPPTQGAYLQRLSSIRVELPVRPLVERELDDGSLPIGYRLVNLAVGYYGGLFVGGDGTASAGIGFVDETIPFHDEFNSVGQEYGVDPRLLAAVARQESDFNPEAGCNPPGGAFGMMQKEYDTIPTLCGDVRRQIEEAATMLRGLYDRAGDWKGALWGYNNGALFADAWAELEGDATAARQYAIEYYRSARNPTSGATYCPATGACPRAELAMTYISETPGDRSAMLAWLEYQGLFPALVLNTRQTVVNGTECPNVEPRSAIAGKDPLRGGAGDVGIRVLCVEAVADAPTPEAARAIIFAFNNLGIAYSQDLRSTPRAFDCSSYVSRAYEAAGLLMNSGGTHFTTRQLLPWEGGSRPEWIVPVAPQLAKPGDLVFPAQGHVAMKLTRGFIIHTNSTGDVSHVTLGGQSYQNPLQTNRVVPELAERLGN